MIEEHLQRVARLQVLEQRLDRHARADKYRHAAEDVRVALYDPRLLRHDRLSVLALLLRGFFSSSAGLAASISLSVAASMTFFATSSSRSISTTARFSFRIAAACWRASSNIWW